MVRPDDQKRQRVIALLSDPATRDLNSRTIARMAGASKGLVATVVRLLAGRPGRRYQERAGGPLASAADLARSLLVALDRLPADSPARKRTDAVRALLDDLEPRTESAVRPLPPAVPATTHPGPAAVSPARANGSSQVLASPAVATPAVGPAAPARPGPKSPPLTHEQEALVASCDKWAWSLANRWAARMPGVVADDLYQEAHVGLVLAATRYDPTEGSKFISYATFWMEKYIREFCRCESNHGAKVHPRDGWGKVPTCSLVWPDGEPADPADPRGPGPVDESDLWEVLDRYVPGREAKVLRLHFVDGLNLQQIGDRLGISRERVRQIRDGALTKLREEAPQLECLIGD